jgi:chloride channel protein, CIC family
MQYVFVLEGNRILGVQRVNIALRHGLKAADTGATLGAVARPNFTIARENDVMFDVVGRMWGRGAIMAVVASGSSRAADASRVVGIISKKHVADSVAENIKGYGN